MLKSDIKAIMDCYKILKNRGMKDKNNCLTYEDKIKWLCLFGCTELKSQCADKIKVKEYVKNKIGKDISVPILKIYNNIKEFNIKELPDKFVLKCNHGSGYNFIVKDKNTSDINKIKSTMDLFQKSDYSMVSGELHYHWIKPLIFVEPYLSDIMYDYRFYCFNGKPVFMDIVYRGKKPKIYNTYDLNFEPIYNMRREKSDYSMVEKPKLFSTMLEYAKILCTDFELVRVDFFYIDDNIYHAELTFTPTAGTAHFTEKYNLELGSILEI